MNALEQLDRLRREAVERARLALLEVRERAQQAERAWKAALQREHDAQQRLARAGRDYAAAASVLDLRAGELQLAHARASQASAREARLRCECIHAAAQEALAAQERALLEAELGRRAVERRLSQQVADVGRRTERQREEEAEDAFRAARVRPPLA